MVKLIPDEPRFETVSEQEVWQRLRDTLGPDDVLICGKRITDEEKDHEADLIVLMPEIGIIVLEIKGGSVWYDDGWLIKRGAETCAIEPVAQARTAKYALRRYVEHHPLWGSRPRVAWAHGVVTPYSAFPTEFQLPELPRWALFDRDDQANLAGLVRQAGWGLGHGQPAPTLDEVETIVQILNGSSTTYDITAEAGERAAQADRLTDEQGRILDVTRLLSRVEVRGGAGSGKTVLALHQAKELTRGTKGRRPQRVALLCYSLGLAAFLKRQVGTWDRRHRPAFVGTFHEFGQQWGAPDGDRTDSAFWEEKLPALMSDLAAELPDGKKYDAVVVDEAQDFADSWWAPVLGALRDQDHGGLYVFSDENQRIFGRFGRPPVALVPLVLDHNLRNTKQIHSAFGPLAPSRMYARGGDGPAVRFVAAPTAESLSAADDVVDELIDAGWAPGDIALITAGHRHPLQLERTGFQGQDGYWDTWWDDDVFYGHVLGCKGLERRAVVLCVNESGDRDRAKERLYVGMSRATDALVVVGDPEVIRRVGGDEVATRLGLPDTRLKG